MADSPARALIIYSDGLAPFLHAHHSNLHFFARSGVCGFLALRNLPAGVSEADRIALELAQLLDVHEAFPAHEEDAVTATIPSISERFMGMKAAMITNSPEAANVGKLTGFTVIDLHELEDRNENDNRKIALSLLELLGLSSDASYDTPKFELVFLHVCLKQHTPGRESLDWIDALLGQIKSIAHPGTRVATHLYLALVLGYGEPAIGIQDQELSLETPSIAIPKLSTSLAALCPKQTYSLKNGHPVADVREHYPLMVVHHMDAVTRRDNAHIFEHKEFQQSGGNLTILADRFLHEIAFKLWRAPKYGA